MSALGFGAGVGTRGADPASAQGDGSPWSGIGVSDSGSAVTEDVSQFDFQDGFDVSGDGTGVSVAANPDELLPDDDHPVGPNVVNVDADLGVEPEADDVWEAIYEHYQSFDPAERNHRYVLPAGRWYVETDNIHLDAHTHFELVGSPFAVLDINDQNVDRMMTVGTIDTSLPHAHRTIMRELRIDVSGDYDAGIGRWYTYAQGIIENVRLYGERDRLHPDYGGDLHTLMVDGVVPWSANYMRQVLLTDGHARRTDVESGWAIGFSSEPPHRGTNIWDGCQIVDYGSGFYVSTSGGQNLIRGSQVRNCGRASIRIGANDRVQDCRIVMNEHPGRPWSGLWIESGGGQVVDNLDVRVDGIEKDTEIVRLTHDGPARLSKIYLEDEGYDGRALRINDSDHAQTVIEGLTLLDRSSPQAQWSDYPVYVRSSNVTFRDCDFDIESQSTTNRQGIYVTASGSDTVDRISLDNCDVDPGVTALRFGDSGTDHDVRASTFHGDVTIDSGATLENALWVGNRHDGTTHVLGERANWQAGFNFGFDA